MTAEVWLRARRPEPPPALFQRIQAVLRECGLAETSDVARAMREGALHLLERLLAAEHTTRSDALDLLAADALMTYSCEAACAHPDSITAVSDANVRAVSELSASLRNARQREVMR